MFAPIGGVDVAAGHAGGGIALDAHGRVVSGGEVRAAEAAQFAGDELLELVRGGWPRLAADCSAEFVRRVRVAAEAPLSR